MILTLALANSVSAQTSNQVIRIKSDGAVDPPSVLIQRNGDTYLFTGDVYARGISVEKAGIVIDGAGHTLMGPYNGTQSLWIIGEGPDQPLTNDTELWSIGIDSAANSVGNLTIQNLNIKNFSIGMYLWTPGNLASSNAITETIVGILLSGADNTITGNYIANNKNGVFFGSNQPGNIPLNVEINENRFVENLRQLSGCVCIDYNTTEPPHYWDNGRIGNFWSDYNGTDANGDGIGDTPYVIDPLNLDRYPQATSSVTPPSVADVHVEFAIVTLALAVIVVIAFVVFRRKKRTLPSENMCKPSTS
jgi:hypothetical protein